MIFARSVDGYLLWSPSCVSTAIARINRRCHGLATKIKMSKEASSYVAHVDKKLDGLEAGYW
jgi:hypothetical protein